MRFPLSSKGLLDIFFLIERTTGRQPGFSQPIQRIRDNPFSPLIQSIPDIQPGFWEHAMGKGMCCYVHYSRHPMADRSFDLVLLLFLPWNRTQNTCVYTCMGVLRGVCSHLRLFRFWAVCACVSACVRAFHISVKLENPSPALGMPACLQPGRLTRP